MADLTFTELDVDDPAQAVRVRGFIQAVVRAFQEDRADDEHVERWLRAVRADHVVLRGAWAEPTGIDPATMPVATYSAWDGDLNVGGGVRLPARMVTDITVAPTHRRQGLMRHFVTEDLAQAASRGIPFAVLTASEGTIYGRFGYGPATRSRTLEVDTSPRFALRDDAVLADGSLALLDPTVDDTAADATEAVFARFHETTRGSLTRPAFYRDLVRDAFDFEHRRPDGKLQTCLHLDADGRPDGYVHFRYDGEKDGRDTVRLRGLVAPDPAVALRLWRFVADLDLSDLVVVRGAAVDDPLPWALVDHRVVRVRDERDLLWLRVLDVPAALEARPWGADASLVLAVADPLGHAAGGWRVTVESGHARVTPDDGPADLELDVATLGSLYLGGVSTPTLAAAGRLVGDDRTLAAWAATADTGPPPHCITPF